MSFPSPARRLVSLCGAAWLQAMLVGSFGQPPLPPAPDGMILDQARIFLPDRASALSERLQASARERSIRIYVVTVRSLEVPPSRRMERLSKLGHSYADAWLKDAVGVVFLVDDESGTSIFVSSPEADKVLPPWRRNMIVVDSIKWEREDTLLREKAERAALIMLESLSTAQTEVEKVARRDRVITFILAAVAITGVALLIIREVVKAKR